MRNEAHAVLTVQILGSISLCDRGRICCGASFSQQAELCKNEVSHFNNLASYRIVNRKICHDKFGPPFFVPPVHVFRTPGPYISEIHGPPCMLSTIAEIQKGQRLGSGYKWLAELVSRVCMAGFNSLQGLHGGPNISGIQILSRDMS